MTTVQGDFGGIEAAKQAKASLLQSGIAAGRVRVWNVLPNSEPGVGRGSAVVPGAVVGGLLGGRGGLVAGAALGGLLDGGGPDTHLPMPNGARIVVDVEADAEHLTALLHSAGAANVHTVEAG